MQEQAHLDVGVTKPSREILESQLKYLASGLELARAFCAGTN